MKDMKEEQKNNVIYFFNCLAIILDKGLSNLLKLRDDLDEDKNEIL